MPLIFLTAKAQYKPAREQPENRLQSFALKSSQYEILRPLDL
jgi:hypothetical protein